MKANIIDRNKYNSKIAGAFFISATSTAIIAVILYSEFINRSNYFEGIIPAKQVITGVIFELFLACSNIGTAVMLYPYLKRFNESAGLGYVMFRTLEVIFILISAISVLTILTLAQNNISSNLEENNSILHIGKVFKSIHEWVNILGPNFMLGINTFIYSAIFFKTALVPRSLAIYGLISAILIFLVAILGIFGLFNQFSATSLILSFPIFSYEMILAGWLIKKGFNVS